ncbi:bifunctional heptose 7-phosphate kinase/heptose 1-phosphate adenyltransferase [Humibacter albus]|uniref:bifunctional heptose 7-phosphate kinase/heptose 1-phosphate adenyltransferase n=1 Tax=Humibacter albus TaxID=427754 RepID=UPI0003B43833|nr:PfkB family carbohydrate kinase [Humibacter albus]
MRVTVVGDTLLDVDVIGTAERLLADAPAPIIDVHTVIRRAGGAGLVASMLLADGHDVELVTTLGGDAAAERVRGCLRDVTLITSPSPSPTPVKTRLIATGHPVARIDEGCGEAAPPVSTPEMLHAISAADAIIVADYGRGLADDAAVRREIGRRGGDVPVVWDPHPRGGRPVLGVAVATPNVVEAARAAGIGDRGDAAAASAARLLRDEWACAVAVTMGEAGVIVADVSSEQPALHRVTPVKSVDPCGAGDRFSSALTVALASGRPLREAVTAAAEAATRFLAAGGVGSLAEGRTGRPSIADEGFTATAPTDTSEWAAELIAMERSTIR